jgi:hypothetical protein
MDKAQKSNLNSLSYSAQSINSDYLLLQYTSNIPQPIVL